MTNTLADRLEATANSMEAANLFGIKERQDIRAAAAALREQQKQIVDLKDELEAANYDWNEDPDNLLPPAEQQESPESE